MHVSLPSEGFGDKKDVLPLSYVNGPLHKQKPTLHNDHHRLHKIQRLLSSETNTGNINLII